MSGMWSFYALDTGRIAGAAYGGPEDFLALNTPPGHAPIPGVHDSLSRRFDLETGEVVDWQPPAPAGTDLATHRWDIDSRRWVAEPTPKALRLAERSRITAQIVEAEQATARPLRELLLDPTDTVARARLQAVQAEIAAMRAAMPPIDLEEPTP